jgi:PAS domain S-box-containing protein
MTPLSGVVELYGQEISRAAQIACQEVNESGGVLGRPLELVIEDDGSLPDSAVRAAAKLVDNHCAAIIGNLLSNSRIAVAYRVAEPRRIPYLNFSFYEGSILSRYFFHFAALPNQQIDRMIPSMRSRFGPRMFFAGNNYEWPRGSIDAAKRSLESVGGEVVGELYYPIGTSRTDLQQLLETVERSGAHVFVPYFAGQDQINLLTLFTEMGLKGRMAVVMGHYDEMMASKLPSRVREGFYSSNTYFMTIDSAENRSYLQRLAAMEGVTGIWPKGNGILTNFGEGAYLCVKAFAAAANAAGSIEAEPLIKTLETIHLKGPQGLVEMHAATHHATVNNYLSRCETDGTFSIIEQWATIPPETPKRYSHMRIQGASSLDIQIQARIVQNMSECVCLINSINDTIIYCNAACEDMFGYTVDFLQGKNIKILLDGHRPEASRAFEQINSILYQKGVWTGELDVCRSTGEEICCAVSVSAFTHAQHGEVWMAVFQDSTERRRQNELLRKAKEAAEQANAAKSLFLAAMSHEIRTPLNAIIGMSEVMGLTPLSNDQRNYVSIIQRAGESLLSLINDLLDFSRAEQHGYTFLHEPFYALQVVEDCIDIMAPKAREKNLELLYEISDETIPPLLGDSLRLRQILFNLIGNAIKFTDQGGVYIKIMLDAAKDGWLPLTIEVSDTGIGIPEEFQSIMFDPFSQANHALTERRGGAGLGLSIVKKLTEAMGGTISVRSVQGQGTTFVLNLRMQVATPESSVVLVRREWDGAFLGKKALLAMKSPQAKRQLENILKSVGVLVKTLPWVEDPREALLDAKYMSYDFVIWEVEKGFLPPSTQSRDPGFTKGWTESSSSFRSGQQSAVSGSEVRRIIQCHQDCQAHR